MSLSTRLSTPTNLSPPNGFFSSIGIAPHDSAWCGESGELFIAGESDFKIFREGKRFEILDDQDVLIAGLLGELDAFFEQLAFVGVSFGLDRHHAWEGDVSIASRGTGMSCTLCKLCARNSSHQQVFDHTVFNQFDSLRRDTLSVVGIGAIELRVHRGIIDHAPAKGSSLRPIRAVGMFRGRCHRHLVLRTWVAYRTVVREEAV